MRDEWLSELFIDAVTQSFSSLRPSSLIPSFFPSLVSQTLDEFQQRRRVYGLCHVRVEAGLESTPAIIENREACDGDNRHGAVIRHAAQRLGQFVTVHSRHSDVRHDDIELL